MPIGDIRDTPPTVEGPAEVTFDEGVILSGTVLAEYAVTPDLVSGSIDYELVTGSDLYNDLALVDTPNGFNLVIDNTQTFDHETIASYSVQIHVQEEGAPDLRVTIPLTINVGDLNDESPSIDQENTPNETYLGVDAAPDRQLLIKLSATDPDEGDSQSWSLSGLDAEFFEIGDAGELSWREQPDYFETNSNGPNENEFNISATVTDGAGHTD